MLTSILANNITICILIINEISFELQMETIISMLMIFAVVMLVEQ